MSACLKPSSKSGRETRQEAHETKQRKQHWHAHTTMCKADRCCEAALWYRKPSLGPCDDLEAGMGKGREAVCGWVWLICIVVWQKPTRDCKVIFPKIKERKTWDQSLESARAMFALRKPLRKALLLPWSTTLASKLHQACPAPSAYPFTCVVGQYPQDHSTRWRQGYLYTLDPAWKS